MMKRIEETRLPGVGVRHDFVTRMGPRVGVIAHRSGHRELIIYAEDDPDRAQASVRLDEEESHALADLLGASQVTAAVSQLRQSVAGLAIDWVKIPAHGACAGVTIGDTELRQRTGATIVAVARGVELVPGPGPEFRLAAGDVAIVVGTLESINRASNLLVEG
jgi:TrkA domain protein